MKLDVYEKFIVLHTHTQGSKGITFLQERKKTEQEREERHSNKVLWTERNRKNKQIHILPGAKVRRKNERESEQERKISWKWRKEMEKDFLLWQIIFKNKKKTERRGEQKRKN